MAEYIEREALVIRLLKACIPDGAFGMGAKVGIDHAIKCAQEASAADVVEVVRCKDCRYWQDNNGGYPHEECRWGKEETPDRDDFCSYGERRKEDG